MKPVYVYLHHDCGDFYIRDRMLSEDELYCAFCDDHDTLAGVFDNENKLAAKLLALFETGVDCMPCDEYYAIKDKYCPPRLRQWELGQFEEGTLEY